MFNRINRPPQLPIINNDPRQVDKPTLGDSIKSQASQKSNYKMWFWMRDTKCEHISSRCEIDQFELVQISFNELNPNSVL